ncbi:MAG: PhzF family phenazine biosynthesis protein [Chloroflexota bacterium]
MHYQFYTCDVFTDSRFGGNPLAVLPDARGLTTEQMQLIAREFNFSESTFVLPAEQGQTRKVRIFTRTSELPFAGHPNIGTAFTLATIGELGDVWEETAVTFEEGAGLVPITIRRETDKPIWCELRAPETLSLGQSFPVEMMAAALSLSPDDIVTDTHAPQIASVGLPFIITELKDRDALAKARANTSVLEEMAAQGIRPSLHIYTRSQDDFDIRARMYAPLGGTIEDPATGSANCALVGMLTHYEAAESGEFSWRIAQGVEMGRPSVLDGRSRKQNGTVTDVWMAGTCVMITEGTIEVS